MTTKGKLTHKREIPHVFVILVSLIFVVCILTYLVPAGQYERVLDEASNRMVIDPNSFTYTERTPVNLFKMFVCLVVGLSQASSITFLIFSAFSCLYLIEKTGALDASIALMVRKTKAKPKSETIIIAAIMAVLAAWASTGTMSYEEIIAFIPVFLTLCLALGYDALVALGMTLLLVGVGFPSASGQAAATMPIMIPIADLIGINRQIAVLIFQFGDGFSNILWPTSFVIIACTMAKVPINKYYKWILPYFVICFVLQVVFIFGAVAMNYGLF